MSSLIRYVYSLTLSIVFSAASLWAQGTVTIFGAITDSSGALIPGAGVTVTNSQTGLSRKMVSDTAGTYIVSQLPVGIYSVRIEAQGFKTAIRRDIPVQVNENRRVDVSMEVGSVTESLTVTGEIAQVETREGTLKEVVDSQRMVELPLNGRNPLQLQYLVAGVGARAAGGGGQAQNQVAPVNGARNNANNYTLDGGDNHDPFFNTAAIFPSPDALHEFSIQTNAYGADRGRNAGANMIALTKSGTNQFHGTLFEFLRNEKLNARNFFAITVPPFRRNQYGGTLGGPLRKDRTFFFVSFQGTRERSAPGSVTATVLTPAQRTGDFSGLSRALTDPAGGVFPGNRIPASRLYSPAVKFLDAFVPTPNLGPSLVTFASQQTVDDDQFVAKVDHSLSSSNQLSIRLLHNSNDSRQVTGNLPGFLASIQYVNWNLVASDTHIFSPEMINSFTFSLHDIDRRQLPIVPGNRTWTDFGAGLVRPFTEDYPAAHDTGLDGYFQAFSRFPLNQFRTAWQFADSVSISKARHLVKIGGDIRRAAVYRAEAFRSDPYLRFRSTFTGDAAADFLLGRAAQILQNSPDLIRPRGGEWDLFVQDDWRVSSRLTLNIGLRWEPYLPDYELEDRVAQFRLGQQSTQFPLAPRGLVYAGDAGVSRSGFSRRWWDLGPRFGFAYDPFGTGKTSLRGGYGVFHATRRLQSASNTGPAYVRRLNIDNPPGGLLNPYLETGNPWPFQPPLSRDQRATFKFGRPVTMETDDPDLRGSIAQQWNLNVQRQIGGTFVVTAAYVGGKGNHLFLLNQINPGIYGAPGRNLDERRPLYPDFGAIATDFSSGNSTYHALQLTLNKRMSRGFTILANYTWAKSIDNASADDDTPANPFDLSKEKGLSDFDIPHRFVASYIWELPKPAGGIVGQLLGGWETNGILTLESGTPFDLTSGRDNSASGVNQDRPDLAGDPRLPSGRSKDALIREYFNKTAFVQNRVGTFGNVGRNILRGPGLATLDFGLVKSFRITESNRLQFRAEAFNLFNRVNFGNPNAGLAARTFASITSAGSPRVFQLALKYVF